MADDTIEISKKDAATLKRAYDLLNSLSNSPEHGLEFKKLLKAHDPKIQVPDVDMAEKYAKPLKDDIEAVKKQNAELQKRLDDGEKASKDRADQETIMKKIDEVAKKRGLTDEGREGLIKTMRERQIADPDAAALVYLETLPKAKPAAATETVRHEGSRVLDGLQSDTEADGEFADFFKNPNKAFDKEVNKILNEVAAA